MGRSVYASVAYGILFDKDIIAKPEELVRKDESASNMEYWTTCEFGFSLKPKLYLVSYYVWKNIFEALDEHRTENNQSPLSYW